MSTIVKLQVENVKRLKAVAIEPQGALVVISGRNGQGKSSVLDSIWMCLGGKRSFPRRPVREGETGAEITIELQDLIVTRLIRPDGETSLWVGAKDGAKYSNPQTMLDGLLSSLTFDPLAFSRMKPGEQRELLCKLVGLDTTKLDQARKAAYDQRTTENRDLRRLEAEISGLPLHPDTPAEEVSISGLAEELRRADQAHRDGDLAARNATVAQDRVKNAEGQLAELREKLAKLKAEAAALETRIHNGETNVLPDLRQVAERDAAWAEKIRAEAPDREALRQRIAGAEAVNTRVRSNQRRAQLEAKRADVAASSQALTERIEAIDTEKRAAIAGAKYPMPGLGLDDHGVLLLGLPFEQASAAEQLRASVAMGLALNPELKVLLVRDGSLLDEDSMRLLAEEAQKAGAQIWCEVVAKGEPVGIVIEDGAVAMHAPAFEEQVAAQ